MAAHVSAHAISAKEHSEALLACGWSGAEWRDGRQRGGAAEAQQTEAVWWPGKYLAGYLRR